MSEDTEDREVTLARVKARNDAFMKSPVMFTVWDTLDTLLKTISWVAVIFLLAQCACNGCIVPSAKAADHDASATMNIGVRINQCGTRLEATETCAKEGGPCCAFANGNDGKSLNNIAPSAGKHYPDIDHYGVQVTTEESDTGTVVNFE